MTASNSLLDADVAAFARLGISPGTLALARIERVDDATARERFGITFDGNLDGLVFPYYVGGKRVTARLRRDHPETDEKGESQNKYIAAWGDVQHLYLPPDYEKLLADPRVPIVFVEAEKSVLAGSDWSRRTGGRVLWIGTKGCWGWRGKTGIRVNRNGEREGEKGALPEVAFARDGRTVGILFDANAATNEKVRAARNAFRAQLAEQGAKVLVFDLPAIEGVNGVDDFIAIAGDQALVDLFDGKSPQPLATTKDEPAVFNFTDAGNAEYFAARHGDRLRYDHRRGRYLLWSGARWQPDADAEVRRLAKSAMRRRFRDAAALDDPDARNRAARWAIASESRSRIEALLYLAQAERPIADSGAGWDSDPALLACPNGVVDLRTGKLQAARPEDKISLVAGVGYRPEARSELWERSLREILPDDATRDFFQIAVGYSATGDTRRDCWFLAYGPGRNGKGTVSQPVGEALGDYSLELPSAVFDLRHDRAAYELAHLPGKRFVTSSESGDTIRRLHHDRIKQLTGGDSMSAADKYEKAFQFKPVAKLWFACNKKPHVTDDTAAFWERVFLIPFTVSFVGREDRNLRSTLASDPVHQAAVLAWIVRGSVLYYERGLDPAPAVKVATAEYRRDSDPVAGFVEEECRIDPAAEATATALFERYAQWADHLHLTPKERLSVTKFGRLLGGRFERRKDGRTNLNFYQGIGLVVR